METQCELKAAGKPYPQTCPVCRLGPCQRRESRVFANAEVAFEGRRNGMNELDPRGSYVALSVAKDRGGPPVLVKISVAQASSLGAVLLENT